MGWESPLGGGTSWAYTCSVYRLDPAGLLPVEPLFDLIPGITPMRVTLDMIDGEDYTLEYDVTEHAVQGGLPVTTHIRKRLERLSVTGTLTAQLQPVLTPAIPLPGVQAGPVIPGLPFFQPSMPPQPDVLVRLDYLRLRRLREIADARLPVLVVTPRVTIPRAAIARCSFRWAPESGQSLEVSLDFIEMRIVSPLTTFIVPDFAAQAPGNNAVAQGGSSAGGAASEAAAPDVAGLSPTMGAAAA